VLLRKATEGTAMLVAGRAEEKRWWPPFLREQVDCPGSSASGKQYHNYDKCVFWPLLLSRAGNIGGRLSKMSLNCASAAHRENAVTMVEVLVAALLIFMSLGGIFAMNARSIHILRATRQVTASSLMAQQRLETIRSTAWPEFSNAAALAHLLKTPTQSEPELADADPIETITVAVPGANERVSAIRVQRSQGVVQVLAKGDLGAEGMLLVATTVQWRDLRGQQERTRRTIIYRSGLTRSGIFGSALGRPAVAEASVSTP
jgi:Tfp pilus assembly protein PilV